MTADDEATFLLATAHSHLEDARQVHTIARYGAAVSMSYYGAFYAAKSILAFLREDTKTHQGTSARFYLRAVHQSDFPAEVAGLLEGLRHDREESDYGPRFEGAWDATTSEEAIANADRFVGEVEAWLQRQRSTN